MLMLKEYQTRALGVLGRYLKRTTELGEADTAFASITRQEDVWGRMMPYNPVSQLGNLPYVCIRIPTGGGKTIMAAYALASLADFVERSKPMVLWLAPSGAIVEQTLKALQNPRHPYRLALEASLGTSVTVTDVVGALRLSVSDVRGGLVIISTIQAFRREESGDLNVFKQNGNLQAHFQGLEASQVERLDAYEGSAIPIPSLANLLRLNNPIVLVDEAHNAKTDLSFDTLARLSPSVVLEWTATPAQNSNVLYSVSASELAAEDMIKLPVMLETRAKREEVLTQAVAQQKVLENVAREEEAETGEYLRPIVLVQAESNRGVEPWTAEVVKNALMADHGIPESQIAIATGDQKELAGIDLSARSCPIRYVITVQALREGWDCPFAYVLAGVAELSSGAAVEQLLGRVLRLPGAKLKQRPDLNRAYAFSVSTDFGRVAASLADSLVKSGFERQEASQVIRAAQSTAPGLFDGLPETVSGSTPVAAPRLDELPPTLQAKLSTDESGDVVATVPLTAQEREQVAAVLPASLPPAQAVGRGPQPAPVPSVRLLEPFFVPRMVVKQDGLFEVLDEQHFLEDGWSLAGKDTRLTPDEFPDQMPQGQRGEIDVVTGRVAVTTPMQLTAQSRLLEAWSDWSVPGLVGWLDAHIPHPDLTSEEVQVYLRTLITRLIEERGLTLIALVDDKFRLRRALENKIKVLRKAAEHAGAQMLFRSDMVQVRGDKFAFQYKPGLRHYPHSRSYKGTRTFQKHYYPSVADFDGTKPGSEGDEGPCATLLDGLPQVRYWIRNVASQPHTSFWLRTATGAFYPDFVALLENGKVLVVEVKGEGFYGMPENVEKREIGELWEGRGGGQVAFVMTRGQDWKPVYAALERLYRE